MGPRLYPQAPVISCLQEAYPPVQFDSSFHIIKLYTQFHSLLGLHFTQQSHHQHRARLDGNKKQPVISTVPPSAQSQAGWQQEATCNLHCTPLSTELPPAQSQAGWEQEAACNLHCTPLSTESPPVQSQDGWRQEATCNLNCTPLSTELPASTEPGWMATPLCSPQLRVTTSTEPTRSNL